MMMTCDNDDDNENEIYKIHDFKFRLMVHFEFYYELFARTSTQVADDGTDGDQRTYTENLDMSAVFLWCYVFMCASHCFTSHVY